MLRNNAQVHTLTLRGLHASLLALLGAWWWEEVLGVAVPAALKAAEPQELAWATSLSRRLLVSDMELWAQDPYPITTAELGGLVPKAPLEPCLFVLLLALLAAMWNRQGLGNPDPRRPVVGPCGTLNTTCVCLNVVLHPMLKCKRKSRPMHCLQFTCFFTLLILCSVMAFALCRMQPRLVEHYKKTSHLPPVQEGHTMSSLSANDFKRLEETISGSFKESLHA